MRDRKEPLGEYAEEKTPDGYILFFGISIEGHKFALIITDDCTGYRWLYGLKTNLKDDILKAV